MSQVTQGLDTLGRKGPIDDHPSTNSSCPPKPEEKSKPEDPGGRLDRGHQDLSNSLLLSLVPNSHPRKGRQEEGTCPGHMGTGCRVVTLFSETCSSASLCDPGGASFSPADTGRLFGEGSEAHNQISVLRRERERAGGPIREETPSDSLLIPSWSLFSVHRMEGSTTCERQASFKVLNFSYPGISQVWIDFFKHPHSTATWPLKILYRFKKAHRKVTGIVSQIPT